MIWAENRKDGAGIFIGASFFHPPAGAIVTETLLVHGTVVAIDGEAVLLRGPSQAPENRLGLRLRWRSRSHRRWPGAAPAQQHGARSRDNRKNDRGPRGRHRPGSAVAGAAGAEFLPLRVRSTAPGPTVRGGAGRPLIALTPFEASAAAREATPARVGGHGSVARYNRAMRTKGGRRGSGAANTWCWLASCWEQGSRPRSRCLEVWATKPSIICGLAGRGADRRVLPTARRSTRTRGFAAETMLDPGRNHRPHR